MAASERVVCFDLGGVLVRICQSWSEACAKARLVERNAEWFASDAGLQQRRAIGDRYQCGLIDCDTYHSQLAEVSQGVYSALELRQIHDAWTLEEYPGSLQLVRELNALPRVTTACLSNTNHGHWARLVSLDGRREYPSVLELRHRLASHLLGCGKPDPRIYQRALEAFARDRPVGAADVYFFDDLAENVAAARAAGWNAFQVNPHGDTAAQMRLQMALAIGTTFLLL
jgi:FMN phosphatase YigB (HAD superfamily)